MYVKWTDSPWMGLVSKYGAWYYDANGVLLNTKLVRRKKDRGAWITTSLDTSGV